MFGRKAKIITHYIKMPVLYPMGQCTFAIACSHCKNTESDLCYLCKAEIKSGFEPRINSEKEG